MGAREETIALWETVSGKSAENLGWYQAFAVFKQECLSTRMSRTRDMSSFTRTWEPRTRIRAELEAL